MFFPTIRRSLPIQLAGLACCLGCGRSDIERVVVRGEVTFQGVPLEHGQIRFIPAPENRVPMAGGWIERGRYEIRDKGGVPTGEHRVEIVSYDVDPRFAHLSDAGGDAQLAGELPRVQVLPERYNQQTELSVRLERSRRPIVQDFTLSAE